MNRMIAVAAFRQLPAALLWHHPIDGLSGQPSPPINLIMCAEANPTLNQNVTTNNVHDT